MVNKFDEFSERNRNYPWNIQEPINDLLFDAEFKSLNEICFELWSIWGLFFNFWVEKDAIDNFSVGSSLYVMYLQFCRKGSTVQIVFAGTFPREMIEVEIKGFSQFVNQLYVIVLQVRVVRLDQTAFTFYAKCRVKYRMRVVEFIFDVLICL